jgi:cellulose synthase (UDP-forming)
MIPRDTRLLPPVWDPRSGATERDRTVRVMFALNVALAIWYFSWLFRPSRIGNELLFGMLVTAEVFNLVQAAGFWWTCSSARTRRSAPRAAPASVDVLVPTYNEAVDVVEPTLRAALAIRGDDVRVALLDDGARPQMQELAEGLGVRYLTRAVRTGAKAGNINNALLLTDAEFVAVFDCDHVPDERFLEATLGHFDDEAMAVVQTPQYYANAGRGVAEGAWAQQALFFGPIARGKDGLGAMFCCGTNMVFRRSALSDVGGFPEDSVTEDFELSIRLHERGWKTAYVPEVLARGLAPEDMASYATQQFRWARGCVSTLGRVLVSRLALKIKLQYLLSGMFFLSGWTLLIYMTMPVVRLLTGEQPIEAATANTFLLHFAPYFLAAIATVSIAGGGMYTFSAFALVSATYWIHIVASIAALLRIKARFRVTPKHGAEGKHVRVVLPTLLTCAVLAAAAVHGMMQDRTPGTLNNVGFALLHLTVLLRGAWPAMFPRDPRGSHAEPEPELTTVVE